MTDPLTLAIGGFLILAIAGAVYLATDDDWREALLSDEPYGDVPAMPEALSRSAGTVGGRGSEAKADRLDTQHDSGTRTVAARGSK